MNTTMRMTPKWQTYSNLMPICFCSQIRFCSGRPQVRYPNSMGTQVRAFTRDRDGHQVFRSFGPMWGDYPVWGGVIGKPEGTPPCFTGALNKRHPCEDRYSRDHGLCKMEYPQNRGGFPFASEINPNRAPTTMEADDPRVLED